MSEETPDVITAIDFDDLDFDELIEFEDIAGGLPTDEDSISMARMTLALAYLSQRRIDPTTELAEFRKRKISILTETVNELGKELGIPAL